MQARSKVKSVVLALCDQVHLQRTAGPASHLSKSSNPTTSPNTNLSPSSIMHPGTCIVCVCVQVLRCRFIRCVCHEFVYSVTVLWLQCVCLATQSKWPWPQSLCVSVPMLLWESLCMFWCMLEIRVRASKAGFPLEFLRPCASFLSFASLICQPADGHISFSLPLSPFPSTGWILKE